MTQYIPRSASSRKVHFSPELNQLINRITSVPTLQDEIPKLYYKFCACCGKKNQPFEQKRWLSCVFCGIDMADFRIKRDLKDTRRNKYTEKNLKHLFSYKRLTDAHEAWQQVQSIIHFGLVTAEFRGAENWNNLASIKLTDKGKIVLDRSIS